MKGFTWRESFRHKGDAQHLASVIRSNGRKSRVVKGGGEYPWNVYEGLRRKR